MTLVHCRWPRWPHCHWHTECAFTCAGPLLQSNSSQELYPPNVTSSQLLAFNCNVLALFMALRLLAAHLVLPYIYGSYSLRGAALFHQRRHSERSGMNLPHALMDVHLQPNPFQPPYQEHPSSHRIPSEPHLVFGFSCDTYIWSTCAEDFGGFLTGVLSSEFRELMRILMTFFGKIHEINRNRVFRTSVRIVMMLVDYPKECHQSPHEFMATSMLGSKFTCVCARLSTRLGV